MKKIKIILSLAVALNCTIISSSSAGNEATLKKPETMAETFFKKSIRIKELLKEVIGGCNCLTGSGDRQMKSMQEHLKRPLKFEHHKMEYLRGLINGAITTQEVQNNFRLGAMFPRNNKGIAFNFITLPSKNKQYIKLNLVKENLLTTGKSNRKKDIGNTRKWRPVFNNAKKRKYDLIAGKIVQIWINDTDVLMLTNPKDRKLQGQLLINVKDIKKHYELMKKMENFLTDKKQKTGEDFFHLCSILNNVEKNAKQSFYVALSKDTHLTKAYKYNAMKDEMITDLKQFRWNFRHLECPVPYFENYLENKYKQPLTDMLTDDIMPLIIASPSSMIETAASEVGNEMYMKHHITDQRVPR